MECPLTINPLLLLRPRDLLLAALLALAGFAGVTVAEQDATGAVVPAHISAPSEDPQAPRDLAVCATPSVPSFEATPVRSQGEREGRSSRRGPSATTRLRTSASCAALAAAFHHPPGESADRSARLSWSVHVVDDSDPDSH